MAKPIEKKKQNYMEYVQKKLKKYRVNSPDKVPNKFKKKFYTELDKGWESKKEKKEKKKAQIIEAVKELLKKKSKVALSKTAPKQPPKGWWEMMKTKVKKDNPEYTEEVLSKVLGEIWYNRLKPSKKKDIVKEYES